MATKKTRIDPYKNFRFRLVVGAVIVGLAGYLTRKALIRSGGRRVRGRASQRLFRVDQVQSHLTWYDLRLAPDQLGQMRRLAEDARRGSGVDQSSASGAGGQGAAAVTALFAGYAGTAKTMAGQLLAAGLGVDLYRVDSSAVVSKYIGETEKSLRRIFDAAEAAGAVLLFEEAHLLFSTRSSVNDSHDRYANVEVRYLEDQIAHHKGPIILAADLKKDIDPAFLRRIRYIVEFPSTGKAEPAKKLKERPTQSQRRR